MRSVGDGIMCSFSSLDICFDYVFLSFHVLHMRSQEHGERRSLFDTAKEEEGR
jgi:hypothetical protein